MPAQPRFGLAVLAAATVTAAVFAQAPRPATGSAFVVGQVLDAASGQPLAGATVSIGGTPSIPAPAIVTGTDGYFLFRNLPAGRFTVSARKTGYVVGNAGQRRPAGSWRPLDVAEDAHVGPVQVRLWRSAAVSGTVLDETGAPIVAADVFVLRQARRAGARTFVLAASTTSDDRGAYRVGTLAPGRYTVVLPARQVAGRTTLAREASRRSLVLVPLTADGRAEPPAMIGSERRAETGTVFPTTFHPDAASPLQAQLVDVEAGSDVGGVDLRVTPTPAYAVTGHVTGEPGPAAGVMVRLVPEGLPLAPGLDSDVAATTTDGDGRFAFPLVLPGQYRLRATTDTGGGAPAAGASMSWAELPVTVDDDAVRDLGLTLRPGLRVRGRVAFEGSGPPGAPPPDPTRIPIAIDAADPSDDTWTRQESLRPGADGEFTSGMRRPGRYFVRATGSPPGWMFKAAYARGLDVSDTPLDLLFADENDVVLMFTDRWTGLGGTVRTAAGAPDGAATVLLFPMNPLRWDGSDYSPRRLRSTLARPDGSWGITGLVPGEYYVVAVAEVDTAGWDDPDALLGLMRGATQVTIHEGEQRSVDLRTQPVR